MWTQFWKYTGLYAVLMAAVVPFIFGWIPPNRWVGFRFPGAIQNPELWYEINSIGGILIVIAMAICGAVNGVLIWRANPIVNRYLGWVNGSMIVLSFWLVTVELVALLP